MSFRSPRVLATKLTFLTLSAAAPFIALFLILFWPDVSISIQVRHAGALNAPPNHLSSSDAVLAYGVLSLLALAYMLALALMTRAVLLNHRLPRD